MNTFISEKVIPVAGDIGLENFGVTNLDLLNEMRRTVDVVVCSAASTIFDERYYLNRLCNNFMYPRKFVGLSLQDSQN